MPLLYGIAPFKRLPDPDVPPETKLYFIQESGECFRSFSDMMERLTVVHSTVWTCSVTKQTNLTLEEAFVSEKEAHKGFPAYGKRPILFIAHKYFSNASFTELVYGVFKITRDRYFLNEWVRFHIGAKALFVRVVKVIHISKNEEPNQSEYGMFSPQAYKYIIEYFDHVHGRNTALCVEHDQISRLPTYSSRNALHKYFSEVVDKDENGRITFKQEELDRLEIQQMTWKQIFVEPAPFQGGLKRKGRPLANEEINGHSVQNGLPEKRPKLEAEPVPKVIELSDWDKYRATEREVRAQRDKLAEERLKLWKSLEPSEDLDLVDLKMLPRFEKLNLKIPLQEFGDILNLYGFICTFKDLLNNWDSSFTLKDLIHAIYAVEYQNKPFLMLMCCLVQTRNSCISTEDYDEADIKNEREIPDEFKTELSGPFGDEIKSRNLLLERLRSCHGASLSDIQVNEQSVTQHVVYACHSAGFCPRLVAMDVRNENRGDIGLSEDELFRFSIENQDLLEDLKERTICELAPSQRLKILLVFSKNLLTYGNFRRSFDDGMVEMERLTQRLLRLSYLEQQYETDYADTLILMDQMFPDFKLKRNGHSKKVDDAIDKFLSIPTVSDAIQLTQMKTRFDYVESPAKREELRKLQRNVIELRARQISQELSAVYKRLGCVILGTDRAFRQYVYVEELSLLFIEGPLDPVLEEHCEKSTEEKDKFLSCTSNSSCPIHSCHSNYQWLSVTNEKSLNQLISGLDARGIREARLLVNLKACAENVCRSLGSMPNVQNTFESLFHVPTIDVEPRDDDYYRKSFCNALLQFEEKLSGRSFLDQGFASRRNEWRFSLETNADTRNLCSEKGVIFNNADILVFNKKQLNSLDRLQIISVSLFQVANSLILECLKEPFVDNHRGMLLQHNECSLDFTRLGTRVKEHCQQIAEELEEYFNSSLGSVPIATTTFANWVYGVCNVSSTNELFFFLTSIESVIKWGYKVAKNVSCTLCGSRGTKSTMVKCSTCARLYHKACASTEPFDENWVCTLCVAPVPEHSSRRRKPVAPENLFEILKEARTVFKIGIKSRITRPKQDTSYA